MTKQFCDRCGKELQKSVVHRYYRHREYYETRFIGIPIYNKESESEFDLCRECSDSLIHWMMEGRDRKLEQEE